VCPHCGERTEVFAHGGGREVSERLGVEFLGEIPLDPQLRKVGDEGDPIVKHDPSSPIARVFLAIAERIRAVAPAP
jgi:ATP-binding protein involved in chromosome partitioning